MKITDVRVRKITDEGKMKCIVSLTFNNLFVVHDIKVSEGPTLSMTYVSGNSSKVESMSLPRKALNPDSKVIIIDDFMRGGGTIKGMMDLMHEFGAEVVGTGVFISTTEPEEKMVKEYISLIELDVKGDQISVQPNLKTFKDEYKSDSNEEFYEIEDVLDDEDEE